MKVNTVMAVVVEVIRRLHDRGLFVGNPILQQIHEAWFWAWVEWRTGLTMEDVDKQIEELQKPSEVDAPIFTEEGGRMRLRAPWYEDID